MTTAVHTALALLVLLFLAMIAVTPDTHCPQLIDGAGHYDARGC
jgi:hypothetical protein